jgi:hypothetical protein
MAFQYESNIREIVLWKHGGYGIKSKKGLQSYKSYIELCATIPRSHGFCGARRSSIKPLAS